MPFFFAQLAFYARALACLRSGVENLARRFSFLALCLLFPVVASADNTHVATVNGTKGTTPNQSLTANYRKL